ncbi:MAG: phosphotransferase [Lentisphaeria bacterium]|jgi:tRNA A-37 threonylcarbamoyl transferase component Bud32
MTTSAYKVSYHARSGDAATGLDEAALLANAEVIKAARSVGDADVYRVELPGSQPLLVKSYRHRPLLIRWLFARRCLRNEYRKLAFLRELGIVRVPQPIALLDKDTLVIEFLADAVPLSATQRLGRQPSKAFFTKLKDIITELHRRGFAHGDFRSTNVMVTHDGQPCLIDFATAVCRNQGSPCVEKFLFPFFRRTDLFATAKVIAKFYPDMLSEQEIKRLASPPWYLRLGRFLRKNVYRRYIKQSSEG